MNASGRQKFDCRRLCGRLWVPAALATLMQATLAQGADVLVSSVSDLLNAAAQARPGDTVIMQDGLWPDADILFIGNGTEANPITLRAQTPGQVILSGGSRLRLAGEYLVVDGLKFANGYLVSGDVISFRITSSSVANHCRVRNCAIIDYNPDDPDDETKWISLYGFSNRLDHCYFKGKKNLGSTVVVWVDGQPNRPNYHRIDHNYFGPRPPLGVNGGETIRVGTSEVSMNLSRTVVENNFFEQCDGDVEIVSNKSGENVYRHNTFAECVGALTLRHGNGCVVEGNYFFGRSKPQTGGVRIVGEDHQVYNNYFADLAGATWGAALSISQGLTNSPLNGYFQVKRAVVAFNTFVNCEHPFLIGLANTLSGTTNVTTLPPVDCTIANNLALGTSAKIIDQRIQPVNLTWEGNILYGPSLGIPTNSGISRLDPQLVLAADGLWRPASGSPALGGAQGNYAFVSEDMEGQPRQSPKDIGCDQLSAAPVTQPPLTSVDVGPIWILTQETVVLWANPADITYGTALGPAQLNAQANVTGTFDYTPRAGTILNAGRGQTLSVVFTPNDTAHYSAVTQSVAINVLAATPLIVWVNPAGITYGTALDAAQLNATANVPGTFAYAPPAGTVLDSGNGQTLSVTFTPADTTNYAIVTRAVPIDVAQATPVISWSNPAAITNGTLLGPAQLNAMANVPGTFVYTPPEGTVLNPGSEQVLSVVFTPADTINYTLATRAVMINVTSGSKLIPIISWANPADITYGTPLGSAQLNATANVPGTFAYNPPAGTILSAGDGQVLTVTFTPFDSTSYAAASKTVTINVAPALINASVRIAYIIPANRVAQSNGVACLRNALLFYQKWFREQMQRNGFGPKSFTVETEADGVTPTIHLVQVPETDSELSSDVWGGRVIDSVRAAGVPIGTPGQVWWLVPETHTQNADGSITGGFDLGYSSGGSGNDPGWALFGSDFLALSALSHLTNNVSYDALVLPELGPYPLQTEVSYPWFDGGTLSSVSSSALGAGLRELAEAFGLGHDFRNDQNFNGNLTGFGFRGIRGAAYPERYPYNDTHLPYGAALALNVSPYFNFGKPVTDYTKPRVTVTTSGTNVPVNGLLRVGFSAFDASGLSAALLSWNKDSDQVLVDEMVLSGTNLTRAFATPYYDPGQTNHYTISVLDTQGNKQSVTTAIIPIRSVNHAPLPFIAVTPGSVGPGEDVVLDASVTFDSEHNSSLLEVEWDLDGDGIFDTEPTTNLLFTNRYFSLGTRLIRARLTDPAGAEAVSAPVALQIAPCSAVLSPVGRTHGFGATAGAVSVTTSPTCMWTVVNTNDWITVDSGLDSVGSGRVTYALAANPSLIERIGRLLIGDQLFTITQRGIACTYSLSPTNRFHGFGSVSGTVKVTTKPECPWTVSNTNSWITVTSDTSGMGTTNVTYTLAANRNLGHRTGVLTIADQLYTITQWGTNCTYVISPIIGSHGQDSETGLVRVAANTSCSWSVVNTNDWIAITANANGIGSTNVGYTVAANPGFGPRIGVLTIGEQPFTVSQAGAPCTVALSPPNGMHSYQAGTGLVSVSAVAECSWTVRTTNSWITVTSPTNGTGSGTVSYRVDENPGSTRTGTLLIGGATFAIQQGEAQVPLITQPATSQNVVGGATVVFDVVATGSLPLSYQWQCNGTNLFDGLAVNGAATARLTLANVQPTQTGNYRAVVSNLRGSVTSAPPAVLRVNTAPVLAAIGNKIAGKGILLTFTATAADADIPRQTLTYSLDAGPPAGASIEPATGVFTWTPSATASTSTNRVTIRVTDNGSPPLSDAQTITIAVMSGFAANVTLVATGSVWKYRDTGEDLGSAWTGLAFDDSAWQSGRAKLGYGNGDEATVVSFGPDSGAKYITTYFRSRFMVTDPGASSPLTLRVLRDDGLVVYLNGREVYRDNMPAGPITYLTPAAASASDDGTIYFTSPPVDPSYLVAGDNVVAVEIHQRSGTSSDIAFELELTGTQNILEPVVTTQPQSQSVMQGGTAAFSVAAIGAQQPSYQWYFNDIPVPDATNATLTLTNVQPAQAGTYSVVVGSAVGTTTTSGAVLTVTPFVSLEEALDTPAWVWTTSGSLPWVGQSVVTHDGVDAARSGAVGDGNSDTMQTTVTGPGTVSFWWKVSSETNNDTLRFYLASSEVARISGEVDWQWRSFRVSSGSQVLQWKYSKSSSSSGGQDQGWVDEVLFIPDGVLMAPIIASQPASQRVVAPATATFNVGAAGSEPLSYQWQFNGMNLTDGGSVSGATTATLTLTSVQANQAGTYSVLVWNAAGSATSSNATLAIITAPLITSQPVSQTAIAGATVTFNAAAIGSGTLTYQWRFNGTNLLDLGNVRGARTASLILANVQLTQAGNYSVVVSNAQGVAASSSALLGVTPVLTLGAALDAPSLIWSTPSTAPWLPQTNVTHDRVDAARSGGIANNQTTWLETAVEGPATLSFWWKVSSRPNHDVLHFVVNGMERARISGELDWQRQTFDLPAGHLVLRWAYSKDSNAAIGQDRAWLDEVEFSSMFGPTAPIITGQPASREAAPGADLTFSVAASGAAPLSYQWQFNGLDLVEGDTVSGATSPTLTLLNVQLTQEGTYRVVVRNAYSWAISSNAALAVLPVITLAEALDTPGLLWRNGGNSPWLGQSAVNHDWLDAAQSGALLDGQTNWIETTVSGPAAVTFWWKVSSEASHDRLRFYVNGVEQANISGEMGWVWRTFDLTNAIQVVRWAYMKDSRGAAGLDRGWVDEVQFGPLAPVITRQPVTQSADLGAMVNFNVGQNSSSPIDYQWRLSGINLLDAPNVSGATLGRLVLSNVQPAQAGTYSVMLMNAGGRALSANAFLSVFPGQPLAQALNTSTNVWNTGWVTGGDAPWSTQTSVTHDGAKAAQSGTIGDNQRSWLETTVVGPGKVSFWWRVSSEVNTTVPGGSDDNLRFYIGGTEQTRISGNVNWQFRTFDVSNGVQVLHWRYQKNSTLAFAQDRGWVDQVQFDPTVPPLLTNQPASLSVDPGDQASFTVVAGGTLPLTYQWRHNGINLIDGGGVSGAATALLRLSNVRPEQAGTYSVVVSNPAGSVTSSNAVLAVTPVVPLAEALDTPAWVWTTSSSPPLWLGQLIVSHDGVDAARNGVIGDGASSSMQATVTGPGIVTFWWKVSSETNNDTLRFYVGSSEVARISGEADWQQQTFSVPSGSQVLKWTYSKNSSLAAGQDRCWVDQVQFTAVPPTITSQPVSRSVDAGTVVSFSVAATGTQPLRYQWQLNGVGLIDGGSVSGATTSTLTLANVQPTQAGNYSVVVTGPGGTVTSSNALLAVTPLISLTEALDTPTWTWTTSGSPPWVGQPAVTHDGVDAARSGAVSDGNSGSIQTTVTGPGTVSFWWKISSETNNDTLRFYVGSSEQARISGEVDWQQRTLSVPSGSQTLKWTYSKNSSTAIGQDRAWVDQVQFPLSPPTITAQPAGQTVATGTTVNFNVTASGAPPLGYQWRFNGVNLSNGGGVSGATSANLTLANVQMDHAGSYSVVVRNVTGSVTSSNAILAVFPANQAPVITSQPASQSAVPGGTVRFNVVANGLGPLSYQWRFNGMNLADGGDVTGASTATLTLLNVQPMQAGLYSVVVGNASGTVTSANAALTVNVMLTLGEALDAPALAWETYGEALWTAQTAVTHDGLDAAQSGAFLNGASTLHTYVTGPVTVSFWWKVSSETNIDTFRFYVGGAVLAEITGSVDWEQRTFAVPSGSQELKWKFKDSGTTGQDRGWLDEVGFVSGDVVAARPLSSPLLANITVSNGRVVLTWPAQPGKAYQVLYKDSLLETEWKVLAGDVVVSGSTASLEDVVQEQPQRFYQIVE